MAKSNDLSVPMHPSGHFTWKDREGVTFASDLPEIFCSRVWNDSCDVGFYIKSARSGDVKLFVMSKDIVDPITLERVGEEFVSKDGIVVKVFNT